MSSLWQFLDGRFFAHLDETHASSVRTFARALQRHYIINCIASGATQKAIEFFRLYGQQLNETSMNGGADWSDWFQLPFIAKPAQDPRFAPYFTTQWRDSLRTSLSNFLSLNFTNVPVPKLLAFNLTDIQQKEQDCTSKAQLSRIAELEGELKQVKKSMKVLHVENQLLKEVVHRGGGGGGGGGGVVRGGPDDHGHGNSSGGSGGGGGSSSNTGNTPDNENHGAGARSSSKSMGSSRSSAEQLRLLRGESTVDLFDDEKVEDDQDPRSVQYRRHSSRLSTNSVEDLFGSDEESTPATTDVSSPSRTSTTSTTSSSSRRTSRTTTTSEPAPSQRNSAFSTSSSSSSSSTSSSFSGAFWCQSGPSILGHGDSVLCARFNKTGTLIAR